MAVALNGDNSLIPFRLIHGNGSILLIDSYLVRDSGANHV